MSDQNKLQLETLRQELLDVIPPNNDSIGSRSISPIEFINEQYQNNNDNTTTLLFQYKLHQFIVLNEISKSTSKSTSKSIDDSNSDLYSSQLAVSRLFKKPVLLELMLLADGAMDGNYDKAFEIYNEIRNESDYLLCCSSDNDDDDDIREGGEDNPYPVLHRLAIAIALVHATPVVQTNPIEIDCSNDDDEDNSIEPSPEQEEYYVDPVRRYLNYEIAYLNGELDPNFDQFTIFELRFVVDGDESDEISSWGRTTLQNYYPDHIINSIIDNNDNNSFLYGTIVKTDIPYGSSRVSNDLPTNHKYQNILMNGGICGRRAFFGRFILRSFGIPTTARPSKGHAALCHWNSNGWEVNLGGGWGKGWTKTQYVKDIDFYSTTQARGSTIMSENDEYKKVKLAQWIGDVLNEKQIYGIYDINVKGRDMNIPIDLTSNNSNTDIGIWYRTSLQIQQTIIDSNTSKVKDTPRPNKPITTIAEIVKKQKQKSGSYIYEITKDIIRITIPAGSYADKRKTKDVKVMKSFITTTTSTGDRNDEDINDNEQIYLPSFSTQGTTILRGGTWKDTANGLCNSGSRLLSGGYGRYENWGFRVALTIDNETMDVSESCPDPTLIISLNNDDDNNDDNIEFVYIPPGTFIMGGTSDKDGRFNCVEIPHHPVQITKGFYLGKYPVTQRQYMIIRNNKNPSKSTKDPNCPVDNINVEDATQFCSTASEITGCDIRLPTEAEWEYSSRGSTNGTSANSNMWFFDYDNNPKLLDNYAWHKDNSKGKSHPVGLKKPNPFGLYDIYGNVCERVSDTYKKEYYNECLLTAISSSSSSCCVNPNGPKQGISSKFKYTNIKIPSSGSSGSGDKYQLTAKVCTVTIGQRLNVSLNEINDDGTNGSNGGGTTTVIMELPYTCGEWQESKPVILHLKKQSNNNSDTNSNITLYFWRDNPPQYGVSIKEFTLTKI